MKKLILLLTIFSLPALLRSQPVPLQLYPDFTQSNNIREYLVRVAGEITDRSVAGMQSRDDWENIRAKRYDELVEMLSLTDMPLSSGRPDLNVKVTGTLQQQGFRIEKLYYESLPGLYVPANLYIPDHIRKPAPAILYQCGHSRSQKVHYQAHARRFAELGFMCLIVETIQYGEVSGEHWGCYANGWFNWYSRGYTPAGVEVWNGIRGIDLLIQRPEVDKNKIGVTGISGGGAMSWFIGAVDPRVNAVAPVCGNSTIESHIATRTVDGHCDCMMMINTYLRDFVDIGALIAPRPLYIAQADRDGLNTIESSREVYYALKDFYDLYDASENVRFIQTPGGHSYHKTSRQGIFAFFMEHLMDKKMDPEYIDDIDEAPGALLEDDQLQVYVDGPPPGDRTKIIQDSFVGMPEPPAIDSPEELSAYRDEVRAFLMDQSFQSFPEQKVPLDARLTYRTDDYAEYGNEIYSFVSEEGWRLRLDIRCRNPRDRKHPLMIILRNPGETQEESMAFVEDLDEKWNIAFLETRGTGEAGWPEALQWHIRRASAWTGRTIASMRIYDLMRCLEFVRDLEGTDNENIGIAARGEMAVVAAYGALMDGGCRTLILKDPPGTQNQASRPDGRGEAIEILNCLKRTDINQIPALVYPVSVFVVGSMPENWEWSMKTVDAIADEPSIRVIQRVADF